MLWIFSRSKIFCTAKPGKSRNQGFPYRKNGQKFVNSPPIFGKPSKMQSRKNMNFKKEEQKWRQHKNENRTSLYECHMALCYFSLCMTICTLNGQQYRFSSCWECCLFSHNTSVKRYLPNARYEVTMKRGLL